MNETPQRHSRESAHPTILLFSGGIESTALLHAARNATAPLYLLHVDYGQRNVRSERAALRAQSTRHPARPQCVEIATAELGRSFRRADGWIGHVPLPARNLYLWSIAINVALARRADRILIGLAADDRAHGSDALASLDAVGQLATLHAAPSHLAIEAPLAGMRKSEILVHPEYRGAPWSLSWSCLLDHDRPCGQCPQCLARRRAFDAAGRDDPADDRRR